MRNKMKALYAKYGALIRYFFIGGVTTLIDIVAFALLGAVGLSVTPSKVVATILAVAFAYIGNRVVVFRSTEKGRAAVASETVRFLLSRAATMLLSLLMMHGLTVWLQMDRNIANVLTNVVVIVLNYVLSKLLVFVRRADTKQ